MASNLTSAFGKNKFFTVKEETLDAFKGAKYLGSPYVNLVPTGGKSVVDVANTMMWKNFGSTDEVPTITATEYVLNYGTWTANLLQLWEQGKNLVNGQNVDSFLALYAGEKTGFTYNLPYLAGDGTNLRTVSNTWERASGLKDQFTSFADSGNSLGKVIGAVAGVGIGALTPGVGFEETYQFGNTANQSIEISFPLYNTLSQEAAFDHYSFIQLFTFQNLKTRTSMMTYIPPKIYVVDAYSLGGIYMAAAYVSNFTVDSIGTTRKMKDFAAFGPSEILIPEAYRVTITFTDLVSQSSNIFAGAIGGNKVEVISPITPQQVGQDIGTLLTTNPGLPT